MDKEVAEIVEHHGTAAWWPAESVKPLLTKIEQQGSEIEELRRVRHKAIMERDTNRERIQQLEAVIKSAPHTAYCQSGDTDENGDMVKCECWKATVKEDKKG